MGFCWRGGGFFPFKNVKDCIWGGGVINGKSIMEIEMPFKKAYFLSCPKTKVASDKLRKLLLARMFPVVPN